MNEVFFEKATVFSFSIFRKVLDFLFSFLLELTSTSQKKFKTKIHKNKMLNDLGLNKIK